MKLGIDVARVDMGLELSKLSEANASTVQHELYAELWAQKENPVQASRNDAGLALADLTITNSANVQSKASDSQAQSLEKSAEKPVEPTKPEKPELKEAGPFLFKAAEDAVNKSIYQLPRWAKLAKPSPDLGCVSSFSNRYREAMKMAGLISGDMDTQYRNFYQVNMDELNKSFGLNASSPEKQLMKPISLDEVKEGDMIQGLTPGTSSRHMGIIGKIENGKRMVYDNYGGLWRKEELNERFGRYPQHNYYRVYLPHKF